MPQCLAYSNKTYLKQRKNYFSTVSPIFKLQKRKYLIQIQHVYLSHSNIPQKCCVSDNPPVRVCTHPHTAVDGGWDEWTEWTVCSSQCEKLRGRECSAPAPRHRGKMCEGNSEATENCTDGLCTQSKAFLPPGIIALMVLTIFRTISPSRMHSRKHGKTSQACLNRRCVRGLTRMPGA